MFCTGFDSMTQWEWRGLFHNVCVESYQPKLIKTHSDKYQRWYVLLGFVNDMINFVMCLCKVNWSACTTWYHVMSVAPWLRQGCPRYNSNVSKSSDIPPHYDVIRWKHFPLYWPFVRETTGHQDSDALMFYLIRTWTKGWANNRDVGDLRHHRRHYDVTVICC